MEKIKVLLYGRSFSGKTTFANTFPKPFFINTDGNVKNANLKIKKYTIEKLPNNVNKITYGFDTLKKEINKIVEDVNNNKFEYETIVFDLISHVWDFMTFKLLTEAGKKAEESTLNDLKAYGGGTKIALANFASVIQPIIDLANNDKVNVVFLAHLNIKTITKSDKSQIDIELSTLNEKAEQWLCEKMGITAQIYKEEQTNKRLLKLEWTPDDIVGNRYNLPNGIETNYEALQKAILGRK